MQVDIHIKKGIVQLIMLAENEAEASALKVIMTQQPVNITYTDEAGVSKNEFAFTGKDHAKKT